MTFGNFIQKIDKTPGLPGWLFFMPLFENMAFFFNCLAQNFLVALFLKCGIIVGGGGFQIVRHIFRKSGMLFEKMVVMGEKIQILDFTPCLSIIFSATPTSSLKHKKVQTVLLLAAHNCGLAISCYVC